MTVLNLPYVQRFRDRHGKLRHYFRRPGYKRTPLPGAVGSKEFMLAYQEALDQGAKVGVGTSAPGSISALIAAYYQSAEFQALKPQTRANYRNILERFRLEHGGKPARLIKPEHIKAILDRSAHKPGATSNLLKRLRGLFAFAADRNLIASDPTKGVVFKRAKSDGFRAWSDADIARFREHWPHESRAQLALDLLLYTGQRRSDVVRMGHQHIRGNSLFVKQRKTGAELLIPLHPRLKERLAHLPKANMTFLITAYGKPMSDAGFTQWFVECAREAGLPKGNSPHGLRKAAGRMLAEAGCSTLEIAAITGHTSLREVERYTQTARQAPLAESAMARISNK